MVRRSSRSNRSQSLPRIRNNSGSSFVNLIPVKRKSFRSSFPRAVSRPIQIDGNFHKGFNEKDIRIKIRLFPLFDCTERERAHRIMIKNMREREKKYRVREFMFIYARMRRYIYIYACTREKERSNGWLVIYKMETSRIHITKSCDTTNV